MSIRLLQPIFIAGVLSPVDGSTLSLSAALEADLVNQGKAVWVAAPELTASELAHASAHARMRPPNGVPIILAQSAIPMILPSSGTMGANGSLTGLTALPYTVFPQPCFMYFPAGKVFSGSPAGMYYASITAATTAQVYNNMYTSGRPQDAIPVVPTPVVDAGPGAYTQTTAADIEMFSVPLPGMMLGLWGSLRFRAMWAGNNNANAKIIPSKLGGTQFGGSSINITSSPGGTQIRGLTNRGSYNKQICMGGSAFANGADGTSPTYLAIDTSVDKALTLSANMATATDYMILEGFVAEILPG